MRIVELFAGIGACSRALERLGIPIEIVDAVEIDKYAMKSFNAIHGTNFETQDILEWNKDYKDIDLITHGSPCQDFSLAGLQAGGDIGSGTRSSLMYETVRIVGKIRPKYVLWENVKNILSVKHKHNFDNYINTMEALGYKSYYQVLNAKDYGIPQNRERVFTISIRNDINISFEFPQKQELKLKLKDMLEDEVDEKYYLAKHLQNSYNERTGKIEGIKFNCRNKINDVNGIVETLCAAMGEGGNTQPKIIDKTICLNSKGGRNGIEGLQPSLKDRIYDSSGLATCIATSNFFMPNYTEGLRIRKLTPKECWRLMGFDDKDFEKASKVNSASQLYKQAGNSIVVNLLERIFENLLLDD